MLKVGALAAPSSSAARARRVARKETERERWRCWELARFRDAAFFSSLLRRARVGEFARSAPPSETFPEELRLTSGWVSLPPSREV